MFSFMPASKHDTHEYIEAQINAPKKLRHSTRNGDKLLMLASSFTTRTHPLFLKG